MRRFRLHVVAVAVVGALALGGCGEAGMQALSIGAIRTAAERSQATESMRFRMTMVMDVGGQPVKLGATGVASSDGSRVGMQVEMSGPPELPSGLAMEMRLVGDALYVDVGALAGLLGSSPTGVKRWLRIGFDDLTNVAGNDMTGLLAQAQQSSPTSGLEYLQGVSGDVRVIGEDTVAGRGATHYRAEIDYARVLEQRAVDLADEVRDALASMGRTPVDVWIDDADRVVKMRYRMDGDAFDAGIGNVEMTFEILAFDVPVDVEAPPAAEITELSEVLGLVGGLPR